MKFERKHIVVDSNVLISAALNEDSISAKAFRRSLELFSVVRSGATFSEIEEVLLRPKLDRYVSLAVRHRFLADFKKQSKEVIVAENIVACRDPKDDMFLSLAVAADAIFLMSGDYDLRVLSPFRGIVVMTPREFLDRFPDRER